MRPRKPGHPLRAPGAGDRPAAAGSARSPPVRGWRCRWRAGAGGAAGGARRRGALRRRGLGAAGPARRRGRCGHLRGARGRPRRNERRPARPACGCGPPPPCRAAGPGRRPARPPTCGRAESRMPARGRRPAGPRLGAGLCFAGWRLPRPLVRGRLRGLGGGSLAGGASPRRGACSRRASSARSASLRRRPRQPLRGGRFAAAASPAVPPVLARAPPRPRLRPPAAPSPVSSITASSAPTSTVTSSRTLMATTTPPAGAGISVSTLSVLTSKSGSSASTRSPSFLSHRVTVPSETLSPRRGIVTDTDIAGAPSVGRLGPLVRSAGLPGFSRGSAAACRPGPDEPRRRLRTLSGGDGSAAPPPRAAPPS